MSRGQTGSSDAAASASAGKLATGFEDYYSGCCCCSSDDGDDDDGALTASYHRSAAARTHPFNLHVRDHRDFDCDVGALSATSEKVTRGHPKAVVPFASRPSCCCLSAAMDCCSSDCSHLHHCHLLQPSGAKPDYRHRAWAVNGSSKMGLDHLVPLRTCCTCCGATGNGLGASVFYGLLF